MKVDLKQLSEFLVSAKHNTYASGKKPKSRNGLKYFIWKNTPWYYKDVYRNINSYSFEGKEIVKFNRKPVWEMNYNGGIIDKLYQDYILSESLFYFLRLALEEVDELAPFRGPHIFGDEPIDYYFSAPDKIGEPIWSSYLYENLVKGDIEKFKGKEEISDIKCIYRLHYSGGLIIPK